MVASAADGMLKSKKCYKIKVMSAPQTNSLAALILLIISFVVMRHTRARSYAPEPPTHTRTHARTPHARTHTHIHAHARTHSLVTPRFPLSLAFPASLHPPFSSNHQSASEDVSSQIRKEKNNQVQHPNNKFQMTFTRRITLNTGVVRGTVMSEDKN